MGRVQVGEEGQVVIPREVRELFKIEPGEELLLLADKKKGIVLKEGLL